MARNEIEKNNQYPVLETERLVLRMFREADLDAAYKLFTDQEVQKYLSPKNRRTRDGLRISLRKFVERWDERGFGVFCVTEKNTDEMIGYCGFQLLDKTQDIEILFAFLKEHWGKGIAFEAAQACLKFGFENLDVDTIYAATVPQNTASKKVLEKLGMRCEDRSIIHELNVDLYTLSQRDFFSSVQ